MVFFTGKGDSGTTQLFDSKSGVRVSKSSPVFECLGQLDELNAIVGWCKVAAPKDFTFDGRSGGEILHEVQDHLFTMQAEAAGAQKCVPQESVAALSDFIKKVERSLPEVKSFLVPGGTPNIPAEKRGAAEFSARLDIARAVSRRAERRLVTLHETGERNISESSRAYANRLSSLFYALERLANHLAGVEERPPRYKV